MGLKSKYSISRQLNKISGIQKKARLGDHIEVLCTDIDEDALVRYVDEVIHDCFLLEMEIDPNFSEDVGATETAAADES